MSVKVVSSLFLVVRIFVDILESHLTGQPMIILGSARHLGNPHASIEMLSMNDG